MCMKNSSLNIFGINAQMLNSLITKNTVIIRGGRKKSILQWIAILSSNDSESILNISESIRSLFFFPAYGTCAR